MDPATYQNFLRDQITALGGASLARANNLSDVANAVTALSNLGGMPFGDSGWTNITVFSGTWAAIGGTGCGYVRNGNIVSLRGQIQSGTINTAAFTLPSGYHPSVLENFSTVANGAFGAFTISGAGVFTPVVGSTSNFSICCTFSVTF